MQLLADSEPGRTHESVFLLDASLSAFAAQLEGAGHDVLAMAGTLPSETHRWWRRVADRPGLRRLASHVGAVWNARPGAVTALVSRLTDLRAHARDVLARVGPSAVILSGDRHFGTELALVAEARELGIPTIVMPFALSDVAGALKIRRDDARYRADALWLPANRRTARQFPAHVSRANGDSYLFYTVDRTRALDRAGMLPPVPWHPGGGHSTVLAVDGEESRERAAATGVRPEKIRVTGQPSHDVLFGIRSRRDTARGELLARYELNPNAQTILVALPQLAEHGLMSWSDHWREIRFLLHTLTAISANVLIALHPRTSRAAYTRFEREFKCRILAEPTAAVVPLADLYVASYSSTVRWAILCGVPVLLFDFYFGYESLMNYGGTVRITRRSDLDVVYRRLVGDAAERARLASEAAHAAPRLAPFDGQACRRLVDLARELAS